MNRAGLRSCASCPTPPCSCPRASSFSAWAAESPLQVEGHARNMRVMCTYSELHAYVYAMPCTPCSLPPLSCVSMHMICVCMHALCE